MNGANILAQIKDNNEELVDESEGVREFGAPGDKDFEKALAKAQKYMKMLQNADDIPDNEIPE